MCQCVPVIMLRGKHRDAAIGAALKPFKCVAPHCNGKFSMFSPVCLMQIPNTGQTKLVHDEESCIAGAKAAGWQECTTPYVTELLENILDLPIVASPSPPALPTLTKVVPKPGFSGRAPHKYVRSHRAQLARH